MRDTRNGRNVAVTVKPTLKGLLNKNSKPMPGPTWVRLADRLPKDGQVVLARGKITNITPTRATFRANPVARWNVENYTHQLRYFEYWAPLP